MTIEHILDTIKKSSKNGVRVKVEDFDGDSMVTFLTGEENFRGSQLRISVENKLAEFLDIPFDEWEELSWYVDKYSGECYELKLIYDSLLDENYEIIW